MARQLAPLHQKENVWSQETSKIKKRKAELPPRTILAGNNPSVLRGCVLDRAPVKACLLLFFAWRVVSTSDADSSPRDGDGGPDDDDDADESRVAKRVVSSLSTGSRGLITSEIAFVHSLNSWFVSAQIRNSRFPAFDTVKQNGVGTPRGKSP